MHTLRLLYGPPRQRQGGQDRLTFESWKSHGVTSDDGCGVRGRELVGEAGREWKLPTVLFRELPRFRVPRSEAVSGT